MAELLDRKLTLLKAKLEDLKRIYSNKTERPMTVDIEIEFIEQLIRDLGGSNKNGPVLH